MNFKERISNFEECLKLKADVLEDAGRREYLAITYACSKSHL